MNSADNGSTKRISMNPSPRKQGNEPSTKHDVWRICGIALLWLAAILWTSPRWWNFVSVVPVLFVGPWIKVLRTRLGSAGVAPSKANLFTWLLMVYSVCFLVLYMAPKGKLLAPLAFVVFHVPLFLRKTGGPGPSHLGTGDTPTM